MKIRVVSYDGDYFIEKRVLGFWFRLRHEYVCGNGYLEVGYYPGPIKFETAYKAAEFIETLRKSRKKKYTAIIAVEKI